MKSFQDLVDAVGGIQVENKIEFTIDNFTFPAGKVNLNGEHALAYPRMR